MTIKEIVKQIINWIMANYESLKTAIRNAVYENGNYEITGQGVQDVLIAIVNALGAGYQFTGVATPETEPGTPDVNVMYIAGAGTYPNFDATKIPQGSLGVFRYNGSWDYSVLDVASWADASNKLYYNTQAGNVAAKTIQADGFTLQPGGWIKIHFNNANKAENPTLNVNNTGAHAMTFNGALVSETNSWKTGETVAFYYDNYGVGIWHGIRLVEYPDFINVNDLVGETTPFASASAARTAIPQQNRKVGLNIAYLLSTGEETSQWQLDMFIGDDVTDWGVANNWKVIGPVILTEQTDIAGQQLQVGTVKADNLADVFNVNAFNEESNAYSDRATARGAVPNRLRKVGSIITYLLNSGWITEQFVSGSWLSGGWRTLIDEPTHTKTFGTMPTSELLPLTAGRFMTIADNIVNKYQPLVSLSFRFGANPSSFNAQVAIIDEDTMEIVARKVISHPSRDVAITLTPEDLPFDVNHSERNLGIWLGAAATDRTAIGFVSGAGSVKFLNMATMEITTSTSYNIALTITKKIYSENDYQNKQIDDQDNPEIQEITNGNKLTATGSPSQLQDGLLWSIPDNIINKFNQFVKATILVINTGKVVVALVDEDTVTEIERKEFEVTQGIPLEVTVNDFDFDVNSSTKNIGLYATSYTHIPREMGFIIASNFQCKYISNNTIITENDIVLGLEITKKLMNANLMTKELTDNLQSEINQLETEIGKGGTISDLQDYITNHRNVFLGVGTYTINESLSIPNKTKFVGVTGSTVIQLGSANLIADLTNKQNISFENITFVGKTPHNSDVSLGNDDATRIAAIKNRTGAGTDKGFYISGAAQSVTFTRCEFANFGFSGLQIKQTHTGTNPFFKKFKITDCEFHNSWYGLMVDERCEFSTFVGCTFAYNEIGMFVDGGNNYFGVCHFDKNYINVVVSGISSNNDSHGSIVGSSFNHSSVYGLACIDVHNGYLFNGCMLYEKGIIMSNSKNICWNNGWISGKVIVDSEPSNQISMIHNTIFGVDYAIGIEGNPQYLSLMGNRFQDARDSASINNNV